MSWISLATTVGPASQTFTEVHKCQLALTPEWWDTVSSCAHSFQGSGVNNCGVICCAAKALHVGEFKAAEVEGPPEVIAEL
jgi:hypothetical protein